MEPSPLGVSSICFVHLPEQRPRLALGPQAECCGIVLNLQAVAVLLGVSRAWKRERSGRWKASAAAAC
jgi:hypothetical protein